ncbi:Extracellular sulfatase Sulf-1 [Nowakowskiella sp. JEL0078]|nr:Extracellular sulfatase Sulf-1 [Nowakowskiella sp. JEL0078]
MAILISNFFGFYLYKFSGGYTKFLRARLGADYLPSWLKSAGYKTYFTGKFLVEYSLDNYKFVPPDWDIFDSFVFPWTFRYEIPVFSKNGAWPTVYKGQYQTDVLTSKTLAFVDTAVKQNKPFFIYTAPAACHTWVGVDFDAYNPLIENDGITINFAPPIPADRHKDLFNDVKLPYRGNFNESDVSDKPAWLRDLPPITQQNKTFLDFAYRQRLRSLQAVDELVEKLVAKLQANNQLDNTYIFYTTDNGYHIGAHRLGLGKEFPFEEDIRVPFIARGPGIPHGVVVKDQTLHVDIATTFTALAGAGVPRISDGRILPILSDILGVKEHNTVAPGKTRDVFAVEFWFMIVLIVVFRGAAADEGFERIYSNNTWKSIRVQDNKGRVLKYAVHCTDEYQLYDLTKDPFEINNLVNPANNLDSLPANLRKLVDRLDPILSVLSVCKGDSCNHPYELLSAILNLSEEDEFKDLNSSLDPKYDEIFAAIPKFKYTQCLPYYDPLNEVGVHDQLRKILKIPENIAGTTLFPKIAHAEKPDEDNKIYNEVLSKVEYFASAVSEDLVNSAKKILPKLYKSLNARESFK